jgi:hypothetical protein
VPHCGGTHGSGPFSCASPKTSCAPLPIPNQEGATRQIMAHTLLKGQGPPAPFIPGGQAAISSLTARVPTQAHKGVLFHVRVTSSALAVAVPKSRVGNSRQARPDRRRYRVRIRGGPRSAGHRRKPAHLSRAPNYERTPCGALSVEVGGVEPPSHEVSAPASPSAANSELSGRELLSAHCPQP